VKVINYALSGAQTGGATVDNSSASFPVTSEGLTTVTFSGEDFAGNESAEGTLTVRIDRTAPQVSVTAPGDGARVPLGSVLTAGFSCADPLSGVETCSGSTANGARLPTGALGSKTFRVTAIDKAGNERIVSRTYTVVPAFGSRVRITVAVAPMRNGRTVRLKLRSLHPFAVNGRVRLLGPPVRGKRRPITAFKRYTLAARGNKTLSMQLNRAGRRALRRGRRLRVRAVLQVRNSAGEKRTLNRNLVLKRRR
jgi:hypothetical protein